jgi:hypothetical protein
MWTNDSVIHSFIERVRRLVFLKNVRCGTVDCPQVDLRGRKPRPFIRCHTIFLEYIWNENIITLLVT